MGSVRLCVSVRVRLFVCTCVCGGGHADKPVILLFWIERKWKLVLWWQRKEGRKKKKKGAGSPAKRWDASEKNHTRWNVGGGGGDAVCVRATGSERVRTHI